MKIKPGYKLLSVAGEYTVVPLEVQDTDFRAMITMNKTCAYLWELLQEECARDVLLSKIMERYDVGKEVAGNDVEQFLYTLKQKGQDTDFRAMITLNKTGAYLWELLQEECARDVLLSKIMERYDVGKEVAGNDVEQFLYTLKQKGLLE